MTKSFYEGLFQFHKDLKVKNVLAESYEVSKDGLVYTFKLRSGVKFHDGTDFNAAAVKTNLDRVMNPENRLLRATQFNRIEKVEAVNPLTLRITLKQPFAPLHQLAGPRLGRHHLARSAAKVGQQGHRFPPRGHGPLRVRRMEADRVHRRQEVRWLLEEGLPQDRPGHLEARAGEHHPRRHGADREADFVYPLPYEQAADLPKKGGQDRSGEARHRSSFASWP